MSGQYGTGRAPRRGLCGPGCQAAPRRGGRGLNAADETAGRGLRSIFLATGITVFGPLPAFLLGGLAVLIREELQFSEARLGIAVAVFFALAAIGAAPAGHLADRVGARRVLRLGLAAAVLALVTMTVAGTWAQLTVALALAGAGHATLQVGSNLLLASDVPARIQGLAFGIKQSAIPLATLTAGMAVPLVGTQWGWRWAYGGAAVIAALVLMMQGRLRSKSGRAGPRRRAPAPPAPFTRRQLLALAVAVAFGAGAANAFGAFLVEYAVHTGMSAGVAGTLLTTVSALGLGARVVIGWLSDLRPSIDLVTVAGLLTAGGAAFAAFPLAGSGSPALWVAASVAFVGGWGWPGLMTYIVARANSDAPATATGVAQAGVFAGAVAGPLLFGLAVSAVSYQLAWIGAAASQLVGAVLIVAVRQSHRRAVPAGE
ncbi:MFS transporter [Phytoactinopolyspora halophila]|uniref:MFS transporter n=1 Tax=Phytoactinopolyspora halophila TaxID=1981511 RepID=UPI00319DA1E5